ncbi:MAG: DUF3037 domain-containing protein [Bacteroidetes bacterium]|nr:DUF3037 domain-containing protein [Bacteroidota bacterium]
MTAPFAYSVLQYKHSLVLGEAINVAVLFQFPAAERVEFVAGTSYRLKAIYPDFDPVAYNYYIRSIETKLKNESDSLFRQFNFKTDLKKFINSSILAEDATVLQFQEPVNVLGRNSKNSEGDEIESVVEEFARLLLPGIITRRPTIIKHNEQFLIKKFTGYIFEKHQELEGKFRKNEVIKTKVNNTNVELKFDLAWGDRSTRFIKPLSFDLTEERAIQDKSAVNYGYLNLLSDHAKENNYQFDLIVAKPQNKHLYKSYDNALRLLQLSTAPTRIVTEKELPDYSSETIAALLLA